MTHWSSRAPLANVDGRRLYIEVRILIDRLAGVRTYERFEQLGQALESYAAARAGTAEPDPQSSTIIVRPPANDETRSGNTKKRGPSMTTSLLAALLLGLRRPIRSDLRRTL